MWSQALYVMEIKFTYNVLFEKNSDNKRLFSYNQRFILSSQEQCKKQ